MTFWCEAGPGSCVMKPKMISTPMTMSTYMCKQDDEAGCVCGDGEVIEEHVLWVPVKPC